MRRIQYLSVVFLMTILCTSCIKTRPKTRIDNPTDVTITVVIDGRKTYEIPPKQQIRIPTLSKGNHTMQLDGGKIMELDLNTFNVMLNPVLYPYIIVRTEYGGQEYSTKDFREVEIDGVTYTGPFIPVEGKAWIDCKQFHYDAITPFPPEIHTKSENNVHKYKIFRIEDFISYYKTEYENE